MSTIRFNGLDHVAVYKGSTEINKIYKGSELVWEKPVSNMLLEYLIAGTGTHAGVTVTINADKTILITGTATGNVNAKVSNGLELLSTRPTTWNSPDLGNIPLAPLLLGVDVISGTVYNQQTDSCNYTLRYSSDLVFLNCKIGDAMYSINGTPNDTIKQNVIYIRTGTTFTDYLIRPYVRLAA